MTEADVETQILIPFLTASEKLGLELKDIKSKESIEAKSIGKGSKSIPRYIPDFLIYIKSLPVMVIEVKRPDQDIEAAYGEARLYAAEVNAGFKAGVNPCRFVLATNGTSLWFGSWDSGPLVCAATSELNVGSSHLSSIISRAGRSALIRLAEEDSQSIRSTDFKRPFNQSAGRTQINSKIEPNTFAADLSPVLRKYFSSRDQQTDRNIYEKAYISSNEVTGYDRILESFLKDRVARSNGQKQLSTTKRKADDFTKVIGSFDPKRNTSGDIQLITGGVGAGKSLFARRYKEYLQPPFLKARCHWAFLNFNDAPPSVDAWEAWVLESFCRSYREENDALDLTDGETQERVFAPELRDKVAYYQRLEGISKGRGELEKARDLEQWRQDAKTSAIAIARHIQQDQGDVLVVVFDCSPSAPMAQI
ncbi:MAG: type I restriction endonuclease [Pseudomonadota bacterium]